MSDTTETTPATPLTPDAPSSTMAPLAMDQEANVLAGPRRAATEQAAGRPFASDPLPEGEPIPPADVNMVAAAPPIPATIASQDLADGHLPTSEPSGVMRGLARGDREATAEQRAALASVDVQQAAPRITAAPGKAILMPGDEGYAPPARIANPAGVVLEPHHYDYAKGQTSATNAFGETPLAMPAPAYETVTDGTRMMRPSALSAGQAIAHLHRMTGELRTWIMDNPHPLQGELAVIARTFKELSARRARQTAATTLGRTVEPDDIDAAHSTPSPEFFELRALTDHMVALHKVFADKLATFGLELSGAEKSQVDNLMKPFAKYANQPTSSDAVPEADASTLQGAGPKDPANRDASPRRTDLAAAQTMGAQALRAAAEGTVPVQRVAETDPQLRGFQGTLVPPDAEHGFQSTLVPAGPEQVPA